MKLGNILILLNNFKWPLKALPNQVWIIFFNFVNQITEIFLISYKIMQESNHAWESTFRKYACPKLILSRLLLDNLFRILVQNLPALEKLNSKKHTPSHLHQPFDFYEIAELRKTLVAELCITWDSKNRNGQFCTKWLLRMIEQIVVFFCTKKEKFSVWFCKNCATVLRMVTLCITNLNRLSSKLLQMKTYISTQNIYLQVTS